MDTNSKNTFETSRNVVGAQRAAPLQEEQSYQPRSGAKRFSLQRLQSGQAVILIAFAMIALLASLGLAIDGGGMFFLYRDAQNAADAAMRAGIYARCTSGRRTLAEQTASVQTAAVQAAADNGFADNGSTVDVTVNFPITSGPYAGNEYIVDVTVEAVKPSYFIYLVYKGELRVSARAVGQCVPPFDPQEIHGFVGLAACGGDSVHIQGSSVTIYGGGHSNGDLNIGGNAATPANVYDLVTYIDQNQSNPSQVTWHIPPDPNPQQLAAPLSDPLAGIITIGRFMPADVNNPGPAGGSFWVDAWNDTNGGTVDVGTYAHYQPDPGPSGWDLPNNAEGLYVVDGTVNIKSNVTPARGVTVVARGPIDSQGGVTMGGPYVRLGPGPSAGILLYSTFNAGDPCSPTDAMHLTGNAQFTGLIYAPTGSISQNGSNLTVYGALIGQRIDVNGANKTIDYDPFEFTPTNGNNSGIPNA